MAASGLVDKARVEMECIAACPEWIARIPDSAIPGALVNWDVLIRTLTR